VTNDISCRTHRQGATKAQSHLNRGTGVRIHYATPSPAVPGGFLDNCRRGQGGPRPGKENLEQHNKDNYDRYNRENALGRRQLRRRKRHEVAEEAPARGRQRFPRWVAGGAAGGPWKQVSTAIRMRTTRDKGGACGQRCQAWQPTVGCDADAAPSGLWRRGENPHATTPPGGPGGVEESWAICRQG